MGFETTNTYEQYDTRKTNVGYGKIKNNPRQPLKVLTYNDAPPKL